MVYTTRHGESFDTERDFTGAERHVLQKLFIWQDLADSPAEFKQKKEEALRTGWNNSGPLQESPALKKIIEDLAAKVAPKKP